MLYGGEQHAPERPNAGKTGSQDVVAWFRDDMVNPPEGGLHPRVKERPSPTLFKRRAVVPQLLDDERR